MLVHRVVILLVISLPSIVSADWERHIAREEPKTSRRMQGGIGSGILFGIFSVKSCSESSPGVFETKRTPRLVALFRSLFGGSNKDEDAKKGACSDMCDDLCPSTCYASFKVDGSKCTCNSLKCSTNATCSSADQCQCKTGFTGNGLVCCDSAAGFQFVESGCVVIGNVPTVPTAPSTPQAPTVPTAPFSPQSPTAPVAPTPIVPTAPIPTAPSPPQAPTAPNAPTVPTTPIAPKAPVAPPPVPSPCSAPVSPQSGTTDTSPPKLLNFILISDRVNVTDANKTFDLRLEVQDAESGFCNGTVYLNRFGTDYRTRSVTCTFKSNPPTNTKDVVKANCSLPVSTFAVAGPYFLSIELYDVAGNQNFLAPEKLSDLNYTPVVNVFNRKEDIAPPALLKVNTITPLPARFPAFSPNNFLLLEIVAQDDFSGLESASVALITPGISTVFSPTNVNFYANEFDVRIAGVPVPRTFNISTNRLIIGSNYSLALSIKDASGRDVLYRDVDLATFGVPVIAVVVEEIRNGM